MVVTFVTSIPAYSILYAPVRDNPASITGAGADPAASVALGAVLELILIIANVGPAQRRRLHRAVDRGRPTGGGVPPRL
jgi:hypothetical protein